MKLAISDKETFSSPVSIRQQSLVTTACYQEACLFYLWHPAVDSHFCTICHNHQWIRQICLHVWPHGYGPLWWKHHQLSQTVSLWVDSQNGTKFDHQLFHLNIVGTKKSISINSVTNNHSFSKITGTTSNLQEVSRALF